MNTEFGKRNDDFCPEMRVDMVIIRTPDPIQLAIAK